VSSKIGEMPTTGGLRPGPIGFGAPQAETFAAKPIRFQIEKAGVDAEVETSEIIDGKMQDPTGPWVVSWYKETAELGELGNAVMAGHVDYWGVGQCVFASVGSLQKHDLIQITGDDDFMYKYAVDWVKNFDADNAPIDEIVGQTDNENLTLITCGGPFDPDRKVYLQRTVVRAVRRLL
jgi:sortase A